MRRSSTFAVVLGAACVAAGAFAGVPSSALAGLASHVAQAHKIGFGFGEAGSGAGQLALSAGSGVAALPVSGTVDDVFVADTGNNRVDEFAATPGSSTATFVRAWGWGVSNGEAKLETCGPGASPPTATCQAGLAGTGPGELEAPLFIAVDDSCQRHNPVLTGKECEEFDASNGDVYVANAGQELESPKNLVTKFDANGSLIEAWGVNGQLNEPEGKPEDEFGLLYGIALDTTGALLVYEQGTLKAAGNHTYLFEQDGKFKEAQFLPANSGRSDGIALDGGGRLYYGEGGSVKEPGGNAFVGTVTGFALAPSTNDLYVDTGSAVGYVLAPGAGQCVRSQAGCALAQPLFGAPALSGAGGVAVDPSGTLYVANTGIGQVVVFSVSMEAERVAASGVGATVATVNGEVNPVGGEVTRCRFEYGETRAYGRSAACEPAAPYTKPVKVHVVLSGLAGATGYHYRLHLIDVAGEELSGEAETFTTLPIAVVEESATGSITSSSAVLHATVNPEGVGNTKCEIEYGVYNPSEPSSYKSKAPCESGVLSGSTGVPVSLKVGSLANETSYHWRAVVTDENGTVDGVDNTFVDLPPAPVEIETGCSNEGLRGESVENPVTNVPLSRELPDCRAYEMVSPTAKNGALLAPPFKGLFPQVAADGERVIASSLTCFDGQQSCTGDRASKGPPFEFARTSTGWQTHPLAPPAGTFELNSVWAYSPDTGLVLYSSPVPSGATDEFYTRQTNGNMEPIGPITEHRPYTEAEAAAKSATSDLSHIAYTTKNPVWKYDKGEAQGLYEYVGLGNTHPLLVGVSGGPGSNDLVSTCDTALGGVNTKGSSQALSVDGRVVFFTSLRAVGGACAGGSGANEGVPVPVDEVFVRVGGEGPGAHTRALSEPKAPETLSSTPADEACTSVACQKNITEQANWRDGLFAGASEDGARALFLSTQQLTDTANQDPSGDSATSCANTTGPHGCNLYLFDQGAPTGQNLIDVSAGDTSGLGPEVQGVMAVSNDGTHVYFVAKGVLAGKNREGREPSPGDENLYLYERDPAHPTGRTTFIAMLPGDEKPTPRNETPESEQWTLQGIASSVTVHGGVLVFTSHGALTADATRLRGPAQVYRYDAEGEQLLRVSIGVHGFNDNGNQGAGEARLAATDTVITEARRGLSISSDGSIVFFQSPVGLTPGALDDVSLNKGLESNDLAQNVYEWETQGKGGCTRPSGCIHLISDGRDRSEGDGAGSMSTVSSVELIGADTTGENVFFATADPLVPTDTDTELDIYDARVRGGFPTPTPSAECEADACRSAPQEPPALGSLGSLTFTGPGNPLFQPPKLPPRVKPRTPAQIRAEELARALRACHKLHNRKKRAACERTARKRYGPKKAAKAKHGKGR